MYLKKHSTFRQSFLAVFFTMNIIAVVALVQESQGSLLVKAETPNAAQRISKKRIFEPDIDMSAAIDQRQAMLEQTLHVSFVTKPGTEPLSTFDVSLKENPLWIVFDVQGKTARAAIDLGRITQYLISYPPLNILAPQSCMLLSTSTDEQGVLRAQTDCTAKNGYVIDQNVLARTMKDAFERGQDTVEYVLSPVDGVMIDAQQETQIPMKLLATGKSTFAGSGLSRKSNVRKALNERVHNILIPTDAVFSFNDTLGTVSLSKGWHMALTIFEGVNLRPAPGGGICQASTTVYRAALAAGFPIVEQKNHSLYVTYYEKFGVGQDATIFPGKQDFKFANDTGAPLLIQAYNDGDDAYVRIYGQDDGRSVSVTGPYFGKTAPKDLLESGKILRNNEIGWVRTVTMQGSEPKREVFVARYNAIPKSLSSRWEVTTLITRGDVMRSIVAAES